jgi:hypothetical protein
VQLSMKLKLTAIRLYNDTLEVIVGSGTSRPIFVVHRSIAIKRSLTLSLATNPLAKIPLPTVEPEVFGVYLHHVYTQQIPSKLHLPGAAQDGHHTEEITLLCKFFALATHMRDAIAVTDAISGIYAKAHEQSLSHPMLPTSKDVGIIYNATTGPCGARKLMVDLYVWKGAATWVKKSTLQGPSYPTDFLAEFTVELLEQREGHPKATKIRPVHMYW